MESERLSQETDCVRRKIDRGGTRAETNPERDQYRAVSAAGFDDSAVLAIPSSADVLDQARRGACGLARVSIDGDRRSRQAHHQPLASLNGRDSDQCTDSG